MRKIWEGADKAVDSNSATKWFDYTNSALTVQLATPLKVEAFCFTTADDQSDRDPVQWILEGSLHGSYWFSLHAQLTDFETPSSRGTSSGWFSWEAPSSDAVESGTNEAALAPEYSNSGRLQLLVYTESSFVEQTTPGAFTVTDQNATAEDVTFEDLDLDYVELGGTLLWSAPSMTSELTQYNIYLAEDSIGLVRSLYANLSYESLNLSVPAETNRSDHSYWLAAGIQDGDHITAIAQQKAQLAATGGAFALWRRGGDRVVTWGDTGCGREVSVVQAILADGSVVAWGHPNDGGDSSAVQDQLSNVQQIQATDSAFAAILTDGSVTTWGDPDSGGDSSAVQDRLRNVQQIQSTARAFAAILADGSVVTWGDPDSGGDSSAVQDQLRNVQRIQATLSVWGICSNHQLSDVKQVQATDRAYAAILTDGSVVTWGHPEWGGDSAAVQDQLRNVQQIQSTARAFAAILADGSVVTWGHPEWGGDSAAVQDRLRNVQQIQSTARAFAAILADGIVVTWGDPEWGGDSAAVQDQLRNVQQVQATDSAFAAILADGSVASWGNPNDGGDSSEVQEQVYTASSLVEQTTPAALQIFDRNGTVSEPTFTGGDLNLDVLEGTLSWTPQAGFAKQRLERFKAFRQGQLPAIAEREDYVVYLASSEMGDLRSQVESAVAAGTNQLSLPASLSRNSQTHFLVYARSSLAEQTTPAFISFEQAAALFQASNLYFSDGDLDEAEIGGCLAGGGEGREPRAPPELQTYLQNESPDPQSIQANMSTVGGDTTLLLEEISVLWPTGKRFMTTRSYVYLAITSNSPSTEQRTPSTWLIYDEASNVTFTDYDLDETELSGTVQWLPPARTTAVTAPWFTTHNGGGPGEVAYLMYLARDSAGSWKSQIGEGIPHVDGATQLDIPADTPKGSNTDVVVYTRSSLVEQTTPASLTFSDTFASVSSLVFPDLDLDGEEVGGTLDWPGLPVSSGATPPSEVTYVAAFRVFLATDALGSDRSQIGSDVDVSGSNYNASESNTFQIPANTNFTGYTHCVVYTRSILLEQSTPTSLQVADLDGSVSQLTFSDQDLDSLELGGDVLWQPPSLLDGRVQPNIFPGVHLSTDAAGSIQSQISSVAVGSNTVQIAAETPLENFRYLTVYSVSALEAQTTPVALLIDDADATVVNLTFPECDLDAHELGGVLTWEAPTDVTEVTNYLVYLAMSAGATCYGYDDVASTAPYVVGVQDTKSGWCRSRYAINPLGNQSVTLPADTQLLNLTHWLVYSSSSLAEQSTPATVVIEDHNATVGAISFVGTDLNMDVVNGSLVWQEPADLHCLETFVVYIAADAFGTGKSLLGESPVGTNQLEIVEGDAYGGYSHFVVYTKSSFVEQSTPNSLSFAEATAKYQVSSPSFTDLDLDATELGGTVSWEPPQVTTTVTGYRLYLAEDVNGTNKTLLGEQVKGTNSLTVPVNTELLSYSHVLIHSLSATTEQRTPVTLLLVDSIASVSNLLFTDKDLDDLEAGTFHRWHRKQWPLNIRNIIFQMHSWEDGIRRGYEQQLQIGSDLAATATQEFMPENTQKVNTTGGYNYTYIQVVTYSQLTEQSQPTYLEISDTIASVSSLIFTDLDLDATELGGFIYWAEPTDTAQVDRYRVYFGGYDDQNGTVEDWTYSNRLLMRQSTPPSTSAPVALNRAKEFYTQVLVFTVSSFFEQTTPTAIALVDSVASVSNVQCDDLDLDADEMGGVVTWTEPLDTSLVQVYRLYGDFSGTKVQFGSDVTVGLNTTELYNFPTSYGFLEIVSVSSMAEQSNPVKLPVNDAFASVANISFTDYDLDFGDIGGTVSWDKPLDESKVLQYVLYLSDSSSGGTIIDLGNFSTLGGRAELATAPQGQYQANVLADSQVGCSSSSQCTGKYLLIYTQSSFTEQTTPVTFSFYDTNSSVVCEVRGATGICR
eukprot:s3583_g1.t1